MPTGRTSRVPMLLLLLSAAALGERRGAGAARAERGDGSRRGRSDKAIDEGIAPGDAAKTIVDAVELNQREIIVAQGMEEAMAELRRTPDQLFDQISQMVAKGYMAKMQVEDQ